ncbi:hypothetical protein ADIAG_01188 [Paeniglutamicibacter gangotriensis Lz1y]|uniref:Uncharacterized protein n=1 Tax=Paeniglutamicibacter gangotriensis Lz1y TaxID=1276920 RepID=M7NKW8_9MICC|nr:hypothetical protein ADIAG_01188 [Paeniglutamicibacter gangotriensis Lz1y]
MVLSGPAREFVDRYLGVDVFVQRLPRDGLAPVPGYAYVNDLYSRTFRSPGPRLGAGPPDTSRDQDKAGQSIRSYCLARPIACRQRIAALHQIRTDRGQVISCECRRVPGTARLPICAPLHARHYGAGMGGQRDLRSVTPGRGIAGAPGKRQDTDCQRGKEVGGQRLGPLRGKGRWRGRNLYGLGMVNIGKRAENTAIARARGHREGGVLA